MRKLVLMLTLAATGLASAPAAGQECTYKPEEMRPEWSEVESGISYATYSHPGNGKLVPKVFVHLLRVDLSTSELTVRSLRPIGRSLKVEQTVKLFRDGGVDVRAAMNGDYFSFIETDKDPLGLHVSGGQVMWYPGGTSSFVVDETNVAHIGRYTVQQTVAWSGGSITIEAADSKASKNGGTLWSGYYVAQTVPQRGCLAVPLLRTLYEPMVGREIALRAGKPQSAGRAVKMKPLDLVLVACGTVKEAAAGLKEGDKLTLKTTIPEASAPVVEAISGGPRVLRGGVPGNEISTEGFSAVQKGYLSIRHPRSAIGVSADGKTVYFLVAEGRGARRSEGLSALDAGCVLKGAGASDGMLFDGGGSAVMMVGDRFYNHPHRKRTSTKRDLANAVGVVRIRKK